MILQHIRVLNVQWHQNLMTGIRASQKEKTYTDCFTVHANLVEIITAMALEFASKTPQNATNDKKARFWIYYETRTINHGSSCGIELLLT